jgi:osmoprotectant transport system permease protein
MNLVWQWLTDPASWQGEDGVPVRTWQHLEYSFLALAVAAVVAVPLGLYVGHTGRGRFVAVNLVGALRAMPSLGLMYIAVLVIGPHIQGDASFLVPPEIVLVVLAIPPILAGVYAGVAEVDPAARDAARGMGMRGRDVLIRVEVPCALPLIFSGFRSATLQVIATATLAATAGTGGLGRLLIDGLAVRDYGQMAGGAVLLAALALLVDFALALTQQLSVSPGLTGRRTRSSRAAAEQAASDVLTTAPA